MNIDTGELRMFRQGEQIPREFIPVPPTLAPAARKKLNGNDSAVVSMSSGGKLSKWAKSQRKKKRKMAKESRRQNR